MVLTRSSRTDRVRNAWLSGAAFLAFASVAAAPFPAAAEGEHGEAAAHERAPFTRYELENAVVLGDPGLRFWGDSVEAFRAAVAGAPRDGVWLALSGGAENGAFGAGLLAGWAAAGGRPDFSVVTGVSTGALMAPYVFLGSDQDAELKRLYTTTTSPDVFEFGDGGRGESLLDTWPLRELIAQRVTPEFLAAIAAEHHKGRRLFVVTTSVDAQRPVVWNMSAIATHGEKGLQLFRDVLLASASIPGVFPPVYIDAEMNGRRFKEMHLDGSLYAPFYVAPGGLLRSEQAGALPASRLIVIMNQKLGPEFGRTPSSTLAILGRSISVGMKAAVRGNLSAAQDYCRRTGLECAFASIKDSFDAASRGAFDPGYMTALYAFGRSQGESVEARWNEESTIATGAIPARTGAAAETCVDAGRPQQRLADGTIEQEGDVSCVTAAPLR